MTSNIAIGLKRRIIKKLWILSWLSFPESFVPGQNSKSWLWISWLNQVMSRLLSSWISGAPKVRPHSNFDFDRVLSVFHFNDWVLKFVLCPCLCPGVNIWTYELKLNRGQFKCYLQTEYLLRCYLHITDVISFWQCHCLRVFTFLIQTDSASFI